ncbi:MAG: hypothetical protein ACUVYA_07965 [Planctomycetota bacterium]
MEVSRVSPAAQNELAKHLARALGWSFVDLSEYRVSCGILRRLPAELACRLRCVPLIFNAHRVVLVVDDPYAAVYLQANQELLGPPYRHPLEFALTSASALDETLARRIALVRD